MPVNGDSQHGAAGKQHGATLIELVVSMVILAIAMTSLSVQFFSQTTRAVEPLFEIRAAELGQALMDEILAKPYDENSPAGGVPACDDDSCSPVLGAEPDETSRIDFDDVDDYHYYCDSSPPYFAIEDVEGNEPDGFEYFQMSICVVYDNDYDGMSGAGVNAKRITIDIYPPAAGGRGPAITFSAYRSNF